MKFSVPLQPHLLLFTMYSDFFYNLCAAVPGDKSYSKRYFNLLCPIMFDSSSVEALHPCCWVLILMLAVTQKDIKVIYNLGWLLDAII